MVSSARAVHLPSASLAQTLQCLSSQITLVQSVALSTMTYNLHPKDAESASIPIASVVHRQLQTAKDARVL